MLLRELFEMIQSGNREPDFEKLAKEAGGREAGADADALRAAYRMRQHPMNMADWAKLYEHVS